jgi:hypothetical protein
LLMKTIDNRVRKLRTDFVTRTICSEQHFTKRMRRRTSNMRTWVMRIEILRPRRVCRRVVRVRCGTCSWRITNGPEFPTFCGSETMPRCVIW